MRRLYDWILKCTNRAAAATESETAMLLTQSIRVTMLFLLFVCFCLFVVVVVVVVAASIAEALNVHLQSSSNRICDRNAAHAVQACHQV